MKVTVKGFISIERKKWASEDDEFPYYLTWWRNEQEEYLSEEYIHLCEYDIEIDAPDNLDDLIRDKTLQALQEKRKVTLAENQQRINDIDRRIGELMAIENKSE